MNKEEIITFLNKSTELKERANKEEFVCFTAEFSKNQEVMSILWANDFKIDDFNYKVISKAFYDIIEFLESNDLDDLDDNFDIYEYAEADIYNYDLLKWVQDDLENIYYCNEAISNFAPKEFIQILQLAQQEAKKDIYYIALKVVKYLRRL